MIFLDLNPDLFNSDIIGFDVTGYIPSNLISMTDGQIYLNTLLFNSGVRPAVDVGLSVSRIGNKVQCPAIKDLSSSVRLEYLRYNELVKITRFKTNVSTDVNQRLRQGEVLTQLFSQQNNDPYSLVKQIVLLYALQRKVLSTLISEEVENFKQNIFGFIENASPELIEDISKEKELTPSERINLIAKGLEEVVTETSHGINMNEITISSYTNGLLRNKKQEIKFLLFAPGSSQITKKDDGHYAIITDGNEHTVALA